MKTAISLPDELFAQAEAEAKKLSLSRSDFYANAIREFVNRNREAEITARLDEVHSQAPAQIDPVLMEAQLQVMRRDKW